MSKRTKGRATRSIRSSAHLRLNVALDRIGFSLALSAGLLLTVFPIFWLILNSFRPTVDVFAMPPQWIPTSFTLRQYRVVFRAIPLWMYLRNTAVLSVSVTAIVLVIGTLASYALVRMRLVGRFVIDGSFLLARLLPIITALVPLFIIVAGIGMLNTMSSLIHTHVAFKLPVTIWLMQGFITAIPVELEDAASLDGCSVWQTIRHVVIPLILPGFAAAGTIAFLFTWNDLIIALILSSTPATQPLSVGLSNFFLEHGIEWGPMSAAAVIMQIPAFAFAFFAQHYLVQGLTAGSVKG